MPVWYAEPWRPFVELALSAMGYELRQSGSVYQVVAVGSLDAPQAESPSAPDNGEKSGRWKSVTSRLRRSKDDSSSTVELESDAPAVLLEWVLERIAGEPQLVSYVPASEPHAVHEIAANMFAAYTIDGGTVHLGGCHLEDAPVLRFTRAGHADASTGQPSESATHAFFDSHGQPLADAVVRQLHLTQITLPAEPKPAQAADDWAAPIAAAEHLLGGDLHAPELAVSLVLAKWAQGQLQVTIGDEALAISFAGWTRTLTAPPAICPQTGSETYHLTTLSDGQIAAAEEVVLCEATDQRILRSDSVRCCVSGMQVSKACCEPCPVSGELALPANFAECPCCHGRVSSVQLTKAGCGGCDSRLAAPRDDARLASILSAAPKLGRYKHWRLADTATHWIAETGGILWRVLVVVDKQTGQVTHAAHRSRFASVWRTLSQEERRSQLG